MTEETRLLLVNNLKPKDYMIITDNFRKLDKEIERLKKQIKYPMNGEYLNQVKWERDFLENILNGDNTSVED